MVAIGRSRIWLAIPVENCPLGYGGRLPYCRILRGEAGVPKSPIQQARSRSRSVFPWCQELLLDALAMALDGLENLERDGQSTPSIFQRNHWLGAGLHRF